MADAGASVILDHYDEPALSEVDHSLPPHPNPLPWGEGDMLGRFWVV